MYEENEPYQLALCKNSARQYNFSHEKDGGLSIYPKPCESVLVDERINYGLKVGQLGRHPPERAHQSGASSDFEQLQAVLHMILLTLRFPPR